MTGLTTVRADGIDWPLATFVDAYGMKKVDPFDPPSFSMPDAVRLVTLTVEGELRPWRYASDIIWNQVAAFSPLEGTAEAAPCRSCGEQALRTEEDLCDSCARDREPWAW